MHELKEVEYVIKQLEKSNARHAKVILGEMRADKDGFLNMFKEMTKGTPLEGVRLDVFPVRPRARCSCGFEGDVEIPKNMHIHFIRCPKCNKIADITEGNEVVVKA